MLGIESGRWETIREEWTFSRLSKVREAWRQHPPTQMLLAWRWGYKPPKEERVLRAKDLIEIVRGMVKAGQQVKATQVKIQPPA